MTNRKGTQSGMGEAERLNHGCFCVTLDRKMLTEVLDRTVGVKGFSEQLRVSHPTLFSNVPVFVPSVALAEMARVVGAVEAVTRLPEYQAAVLSRAPSIASHDFGPIGAFMGYDFHITPEGPRLIEVNTNAGGAFLNAALARAQLACCTEAPSPLMIDSATVSGEKIARMFIDEWRHQRGHGKPGLIAIVDDTPELQHLYPEFQLAKALLEENGIETIIADAEQLSLVGRALSIHGRSIDLIYNRLVDFSLEEPRHAALRTAYLDDAVVVTPNPHVHALFADKRNLALLSEFDRLSQWGLSPSHVAALETAVLKTVVVSPNNAEELWRGRDRLFFKPARGYGSKAAYRGEKVTRRVWGEIIAGDYVAQAYAPPGIRGIDVAGVRSELKVDVRLYTYAGNALLAAARLYRGQTTNMRTPGGGFAPVLEVGSHAHDCGDSLAPRVR
ncbi:MAG: hypothetical protein ABJA60_11650 [Nitrosospira sp.]